PEAGRSARRRRPTAAACAPDRAPRDQSASPAGTRVCSPGAARSSVARRAVGGPLVQRVQEALDRLAREAALPAGRADRLQVALVGPAAYGAQRDAELARGLRGGQAQLALAPRGAANG